MLLATPDLQRRNRTTPRLIACGSSRVACEAQP